MLTNYSSSSYNSLQWRPGTALAPASAWKPITHSRKCSATPMATCRPASRTSSTSTIPSSNARAPISICSHMIKARWLLRVALRQGTRLQLPPTRPRDRRLDLRQRHGVAIGRAVFHPLRHAARSIAQARSYYNTADTTFSGCGAIQQSVKFQMTGNGPHDDLAFGHQSPTAPV